MILQIGALIFCALATACSLLTPTIPTVVIASPASGSVFREGEQIAVQSTATDPSGITRVELLVDNVIVRSDPAPRSASFTLSQSWVATQGAHTLTVRAFTANGASNVAGISILVAPATVAAVPTQISQPTATIIAAPTSSARATILPSSTATLAPGGLAIQSFTAETKDIPGGKQITFAWKSSGAVNARITSGTSQRFPQVWNVQANGTLVVEMKSTTYPNPQMTLTVYDAQNNQVSKSVQIAWACAHTYFFAPAPGTCPQSAAASTPAAEQAFQNGRMIWLKELRVGDVVSANVILVLFSDGSFNRFTDTWVEGMPELDTSIAPPSGVLQPVRGFGKVWRENSNVRNKIGWATASEKGFTSTWQAQMRESLPSAGNLKILDGKVIEVLGDPSGAWKFVSP
ncbi:MAG: Ig-like domain-containing protein [Chloroflexi bacterium]|nr:Ig-like domain-containing protein [Chloroflexota bacterium]